MNAALNVDEPQGPARCEGCGELDVEKDGWCPRCNEEFGDRDKQREDLAPLA